MFGGFEDEPQAPDSDCKTWAEYLKVFSLWVLVLGFLKLIITSGFDGFQDLMMTLITYCGARSYSYCMIVFFVMIAFFQLVKCVTVIGGGIQNSTPMFNKKNVLITVVYLASVVTYVAGKIPFIKVPTFPSFHTGSSSTAR